MKLILAALALLALVLWSRREPEAVPWPLYREGDDGLPPVDVGLPFSVLRVDHNGTRTVEWPGGHVRLISAEDWTDFVDPGETGRWYGELLAGSFGEPVRR